MPFSSTIFAETISDHGEKGRTHRPGLMVPVLMVPLTFVVVCFFNAMGASDAGQSIGLFLNNTGAIARKYDTEIQPAGWTFSIWGVIYAWQAVWIIYGLTTICRSGLDGYLYFSPPMIPPVLYISYAVNNLLNIGWLLTWDRQLLVVALIFLALMTAALYVCMFASFRAMSLYRVALAEHDMMADVWCVRILVQNGIALYATWITIATLINLSTTLTYSANMNMPDACTVCLSILLVEILAWVGADTFLLDNYTRYLVTPHCVIIFALSGVLVKNYVPGARNSIFGAVLMAFGIAALASKITLLVVRHIRSPTVRVDITPHIQMANVDNKKYNKEYNKEMELY